MAKFGSLGDVVRKLCSSELHLVAGLIHSAFDGCPEKLRISTRPYEQKSNLQGQQPPPLRVWVVGPVDTRQLELYFTRNQPKDGTMFEVTRINEYSPGVTRVVISSGTGQNYLYDIHREKSTMPDINYDYLNFDPDLVRAKH